MALKEDAQSSLIEWLPRFCQDNAFKGPLALDHAMTALPHPATCPLDPAPDAEHGLDFPGWTLSFPPAAIPAVCWGIWPLPRCHPQYLPACPFEATSYAGHAGTAHEAGCPPPSQRFPSLSNATRLCGAVTGLVGHIYTDGGKESGLFELVPSLCLWLKWLVGGLIILQLFHLSFFFLECLFSLFA